jgi:putative component of toxin-antitoxin plasmid stabilization module
MLPHRQAPVKLFSCIAHARSHSTRARVPPTTPFVPDANTFLTLIGRGLAAQSSKIPSWDALFTLSSEQLRDSGIEPARTRKYLIHQRERFRNGVALGVGADLKHVVNGVAELRVEETTGTQSWENRRAARVINVPVDASGDAARQGSPVAGLKTLPGGLIAGPHVQSVKGVAFGVGRARLVVKDGMWEQRRGHKIDGGERRKAEVRFKRRIAESRARRV